MDLDKQNIFYTNLFVINSADFDEISRSLEGTTIYKYDLESKDKSAFWLLLILKNLKSSQGSKKFQF